MADRANKPINLLLVGRTGNGKSSTGNSILGNKEFTPQNSSSSVTYNIQIRRSVFEDVRMAVVDGPGIGDTISNLTEGGKSMIRFVEEALSLISNKLTALLIVLKYGVRFTNQEKEAIQMIKMIFGEDIIKNYGIIVMTHGDSFEMDMEDEGQTFGSWCDQQTGDVRALFDECDKRLVLFNNRSKDADQIKRQKVQLLNMVADIQQRLLPYNDGDFKNAELGRKKLIVMGKLSELSLKTDNILEKITKRLNELGEQGQSNSVGEIQKLLTELQKHERWLEIEDEGTGLVKHILMKISITESRIKTKKNLQSRRLESAALEQEMKPQRKTPSQQGESESPTSSDGFILAFLAFLFLPVIYLMSWVVSFIVRSTRNMISSREGIQYNDNIVKSRAQVLKQEVPDSARKDE